jgi:hypothetical protein
VSWPRSSSRTLPSTAARAAPDVAAVEGAAPGIAAIFEGVSQDRSKAVLDLGAATDQNLRVYSRFARWIHFADLFGEPWANQSAVGLNQPKLDRRYDLVFGWDILDRLFPEMRSQLVQWLTDNTTPGARVHVVVRASEDAIACPLRFTIVDIGRIRYEPAGTARLPSSRLLPAEVAKVLAPLRVAHAFTLKNGLREYMAIRP